MTIALTDDDDELARVVRSTLDGAATLASARHSLEGRPVVPPAFWSQALSQGWLGIHLEERFGGQGFGLHELAIVVEELGRQCAPGPLMSSVWASAALQAIGGEDLCAVWLPKLASGSVAASVVDRGDFHVVEGRLSGYSAAAIGGADADLLLVFVGDDVAVVESGDRLSFTARDSLDPTRTLEAITASAVPVIATLRNAAPTVRELGWCLMAAEAVGGMRACLDMATQHARAREQFGRPIGSFQAVKHLLVDSLARTELATAAVWDAVRRSSRGLAEPSDSYAAACAALVALPEYVRVAQKTIQVLGGIGFTWEHDAHLFLRRAASLHNLFCDEVRAATSLVELRKAGVARRSGVSLPEEARPLREEARRARVEIESMEPQQQRTALARSGYYVPHWPSPYGRGASALEQLVIDEELAGLERPSLAIGDWILPTVLEFSTPGQQERWMWPSLDGEIRWCQLFSEPGAGSDAAAIATKGRRVPGGWKVSGQKTWTSLALQSERGLITVRTDSSGPKHAGITAMALDLTSPGIDIRPIREITGDTDFNEVFLDEVFVPDEDVVGTVGDGWLVARSTFNNERVSLGERSTSMTAGELLDLEAVGTFDDAVLMHDYGMLLAEDQALRALNLRRSARAVFAQEPGAEGNIAKLVGAEHAQRVAEIAMRMVGPDSVLVGMEVPAHTFLYVRCLTIAGGTSEVMRSLIAERFLGLPRS